VDFPNILRQSAFRIFREGKAVELRSVCGWLSMVLALTLSAAANAGWREDIGTFHIGLAASDANSVSPADITKIQASYAKALGMPVEISVLRDYPALIDAQVSGRLEYAIYSSTAYASAWLLCECVEPLVAPVLNNGSTGTRSVLIVNASSPFTRLDLNQIRVGIPGKDSVTGFLVPLTSYTIGTRSLSQNEEFFDQFKDLESTVVAFVSGDVDAFFGWTASNESGPIDGAGIMGTGEAKALSLGGKSVELKVPWQSSLLRYGPHAVRRDLDAQAKTALLAFLQSPGDELIDLLSVAQGGGTGKFVPVRHAEYELAIQAAKTAAAITR
jgi:phosphonate transport system substrate-binding protein